jgi:spermidine synthase
LSAELSSLTTPKSQASRQRTAFGLMTASGFAGLGYQIVWTQQSTLWLGHESAAILAVVAAFFGGLAAGALLLAPRIDRSVRPERWYAACEIAIAAWSIVLAVSLAPVSDWMLDITGLSPSPAWQWTVAFFGTFFVLLPATAAMGATLPAMERVLAQFDRSETRIAALYASNTFGAVLGVLVTAFWLVPQIGLTRSAGVCATLNVLCALAALSLSGPPLRAATAAAAGDRRVLTMLAATGFLGIGYEVLVVRVLSQVAEDTVYTFAMLLAVYLVGSALGAAAYRRWSARAGDPARLRTRLLCLQGASCLLGTASLWGADQVRLFAQHALGAGTAPALASEALIAVLAFALPTVVMGALFSHLCTQAKAAGHSFGRALGLNTIGAASAPIVFGVLCVPLLGPKLALLLVAASYLALALPTAAASPAAWLPAGAALALGVWAPSLAFVDVPEGGHVVSYRDGVTASVSVVEDAGGVARLRIDNRQQEGSSASLFADARQAWLALLLHPDPRHALFLGLGTGVTAASAAEDPTLQVDAVELLPEVIAASTRFTNEIPGSAARLHVMAADARRYVRVAQQRYDVIVADNFHPARSGSGALYTVEHFEAVRARLTQQGVFCQWLPLHQLDLDTLRSIVQAFIAAYPNSAAMLATNSLETPVLGLVARRDAGIFDVREARQRLAVSALAPRLSDYGIVDEFALLGSLVAGPSALRRFAGDAPINTDDRPIVAYRAPRITYEPDSLPRDRLVALLHELKVEPTELVAAGQDIDAQRRLAAYWAARNRFIEVGRLVRPSPDVRRMLSQVREPLLDVLRISPDFRPAYDPLLRMAAALERTDPTAARSLLEALKLAQPARPEAEQALLRVAAP